MKDIAFESFPKMARLNREIIISEKLDGSNASVIITDDGRIAAASRNRLITPTEDNYGFARWVEDHKEELLKLGPGRHFGEWWGGGIQRGYGLKEKRFSLFNVHRWLPNSEARTAEEWGKIINRPGVAERVDDVTARPGPNCCFVVPTIWRGPFDSFDARDLIEILRSNGSFAAPGFMQPEGIVLYHTAAEKCFKVTLENDEKPKGLAKPISSAQLTAGKKAADEVFRQKCKTT